MDENCVFCRIVRGQIPSPRVYEDDQVIARWCAREQLAEREGLGRAELLQQPDACRAVVA